MWPYTLINYCCIIRPTPADPLGWWIIILELGNARLIPSVPAVSNNDAALQACPMHHVEIGVSMYCIVSYIANPAVTTPPRDIFTVYNVLYNSVLQIFFKGTIQQATLEILLFNMIPKLFKLVSW